MHHVDGRLVHGLVDEDGEVVVGQGDVLDGGRGAALAAGAGAVADLGLKNELELLKIVQSGYNQNMSIVLSILLGISHSHSLVAVLYHSF